MAGALRVGTLRRVPRPVNAGRRVPLERDRLLLALLKRVLRVAKRGGDALPLVSIPAPGEEQSGSGGNEEKDRWHG